MRIAQEIWKWVDIYVFRALFLSHALSTDFCVKISGAPSLLGRTLVRKMLLPLDCRDFFASNAADDISGDKSFL